MCGRQVEDTENGPVDGGGDGRGRGTGPISAFTTWSVDSTNINDP